jgi:hypothetical protein
MDFWRNWRSNSLPWIWSTRVEERRCLYHAIVERDPSQSVFLDGWLARLREFDPGVEGLVA